MARTFKEEDYTSKRNEIIEVAQRIVYTKGYEQMSIQDILDGLKISKGAFYHYFSSKPALLEALIERTYEEAEKMLLPIVQDTQLNALAKLLRFFDSAARWKTDRKEYFLALLRIWYADENAIVRQKLQATMIKRAAPLLSTIVQQGIQEGVFTSPYPDQSGEIAFSMMLSLGDAFAQQLLYSQPGQGDLESMKCSVAAYTSALERILGAPPGSLHLIDDQTLKEWIVLPANHPS